MRWPLAFAVLAFAAFAADEPGPADFAWRATLDTGGRSGLVRVAVPGDALARVQSRDAADLRVFDAQGRPVPFAFFTTPLPPAAAPEETPAFAALPLFTAEAGSPTSGAVQVRIEQNGQDRTVWMQAAAPAASAAATARLPAAVFDTRAQKDAVAGLVVRARLPANMPVRFDVATSTDLANWTPVPASGRIYHFEGAGAPANERLAFAAPVSLQDRYLRLDWSGQADVAVDAIAGLLPARRPPPGYPGADLTQPIADGPAALEWQLGFAMPLRRLEVRTTRADTLVPVRVLGRNQASEPWRPLAQAVVYRLGAGAEETTNAPIELPHPSVRWLRVEATHAARLEGVPLVARVGFDPLELVFVAGNAGPYRLAAGRAGTPPSALSLAVLASATTQRIEDLPAARIGQTERDAVPAVAWWARWLPHGLDAKTAGLWFVLAVGVLLLAGVSWSLLRQLKARGG
jgi:hypothetical protein